MRLKADKSGTLNNTGTAIAAKSSHFLHPYIFDSFIIKSHILSLLPCDSTTPLIPSL